MRQLCSPALPNEEKLFEEIFERSRRLRNAILYNTPKSNQRLSENNKSHNLGMTTKIYTILDLQLRNNISFLRKGKAGNIDNAELGL